MDRFAHGEPSKEPDIDFNDVFGGPPKRSSSHESRYSFTESTRRNSRTLEDDGDAFLQRNPWSGVRERPVFGEEMGNRRRYPSDDFYEDIFRGDESPRRSSHETFGPGLGSLSPSQPVLSGADPFGSSLPAQIQFSLPPKLTKGSSSIYRPSPLSHDASLLTEELRSPEVQNKVKNDFKNTEVTNIGNQFHFSIYKWARNGVPSLMPLRGVKSGKLRESIGETIERSDVQDLKRNLSGNKKVHHAEEIKKDISSSPKSSLEGIKVAEVSETMNTNVEAVSIGVVSSDKREEIKTASQGIQEAQKPEMKSLRSFLGTPKKEDKGNTNKKFDPKENPTKKATSSHSIEDISKKMQKHKEKKYDSKREEVIQSVDSKRASKENIGRSKVKGKVKEFVKKFDQGTNQENKIDVETRNQSSELESSSFEKSDKETSASVMMDKKLEEPKKQYSHLKTSVADVKGNLNDQKDDKASNLEPHPENAQATDENIDDLFHEIFTVQELHNDQEKPVQGEEIFEDVQTSDARIRKWSRGKEGNIRSLLSTLQYVLWPESGWKPVPLVDIIEGSAVKRSYQKALLCLHPDKLQQKGAADYQKYIAAKVFDILQEAWDQFNTLSLM